MPLSRIPWWIRAVSALTVLLLIAAALFVIGTGLYLSTARSIP